MSFTVTGSATNGGSDVAVKVWVITSGVEAGGNSASNTAFGTPQYSFTPTFSTSLILEANYSAFNSSVGMTPAANNTTDQQGTTATLAQGWWFGHYTGTVTASTPVTLGGATDNNWNSWAAYEVKPSGGSTPSIDASTPAGLSGGTGSATTAAFTPPAGAVLVAAVLTNPSAASTVSVTDTSGLGLTWTQRTIHQVNFEGLAAIYTTSIPGGGGGNVAGAVANVAVAGLAGTPAGAGNVSGAVANVAAGAPTGTPAGAANVTGSVATVVAAALAGAAAGAANVNGVTATVVVTAPPGTPSAGGSANVAGATATVVAFAPPGTPQGNKAANVAGVTATVIAFAPAGAASGTPPLDALLVTGTIAVAQYSGTISLHSFTGTVKNGGPVVPVQSDITGNLINNDVYANVQILYQGAPLNLTGYTVKVVLKATRNVPDASGVTFTAGSGITITSVPLGQFTLDIPRSDLANPAMMWYRVDVIDGAGEVFSALYGNFQVVSA